METSTKTGDPTRCLQDEPWYHGLRSRTEVTPLLRHKGDFLVRANRLNHRFEIILSLCIASEEEGGEAAKVAHFALCHNVSERTWELSALVRRNLSSKSRVTERRARKFFSVSELVDYYKDHPIMEDVRLKHGINRPRWLIPTGHLHFHHKKGFLGKGNFAKVVRGKLKSKGGGHVVAIKMLLGEGEVEDEDELEKGRDALMREAKVMSRYKHQNVITFFGVACEKPPIMIVMEFCAGGSLEDHLKKEGDLIVTGERILFLLEAARGLRYLHHHGCIHRDLAVRNCLIANNGVVKIADFGLSKITDKNEHAKDDEDGCRNMPLRWMAPETISRTPRYSTKSDVWAFGVMSFEVFNNGVKPWADSDDNKMISRAIRKGNMPPLPEKTPEKVHLLVKCCWDLSMDQRPELKEIVRSLVEIQASSPEFAPPAPVDCSTNRRKGVRRSVLMDDGKTLLEEKSLDKVNSCKSGRDDEANSRSSSNTRSDSKHNGAESPSSKSTRKLKKFQTA